MEALKQGYDSVKTMGIPHESIRFGHSDGVIPMVCQNRVCTVSLNFTPYGICCCAAVRLRCTSLMSCVESEALGANSSMTLMKTGQ